MDRDEAWPITAEQRRALEALATSETVAHRIAVEARALRLLADGCTKAEAARQCGVGADTVRRWQLRFMARGVEGVGTIAPGRGRKPTITPETVEAIVHLTLHVAPENGQRAWSTRTLGKRLGVSKDTVARVWRARGLQPPGHARSELPTG